jgi:hypothetical protein
LKGGGFAEKHVAIAVLVFTRKIAHAFRLLKPMACGVMHGIFNTKIV